jgi:2-dehydro-3-deoxyphosphogluconate aldolase/(4S)-4-hydroxy-2-oxoglutarate aldolase
MLEAVASPFKHIGVQFMPTGGVNKDNLESYLKLDVVAAVGGTWFARNEDLAAGRWDDISNRCRAALAVVAKARGLT